MTIEYFGKLLQGNNAIRITDDLVIYNDFELYCYSTEESKNYDSLEELIKDNPTVRELIENTKEFYLKWNGGRGSSSSSGKMGGGFGNAIEGKGGKSEKLLNAELNYGTSKGNSVESVLGRFKDKYGNADREYAIAVDKNGYVHQHIKGGKHSVGISGNEGETIIHNHPSGSNFSKADLQNFATTKVHSIIATSSSKTTKGTYQISKTNHFKAKEFDKALSKAKWSSDMDYNTGASWWLKKNQKTYGYKFSQKGVKIGAEWKN